MRPALVLLALSLSSAPALAQTAEGPVGQRPTNFWALGVGASTDYPGADEYNVIPFGAFRLETRFADIQSRGLQVGADVLAPRQRGARVQYALGPQIGLRFGRQDDVSDSRVRALGETDNAIEVGVFAGVSIGDVAADGDRLSFGIDGSHDVTDTYEGAQYGASLSYRFATPREWGVSVSLGAQHSGDGYVDSAFSITPAQAVASGLAAYDADSGLDQLSLGLNVRRSVSREWFVGALINVSWLTGDAAESPIVTETGSRIQPLVGLTVGRTF